MYEYSVFHWYNDEYNLVILSALQTHSTNISDIFRIFDIKIWISILCSILLTALVLFINGKSIKYKSKPFINILFDIFRHLVNQSLLKVESNPNIVTNLWSFSALISTACFSAGILSSILNVEHNCINSVVELMHTDMNAFIFNDSEIWHFYHRKITEPNSTLDPLLQQIMPKMITTIYDRDNVEYRIRIV